jgi:hypothetical protein
LFSFSLFFWNSGFFFRREKLEGARGRRRRRRRRRREGKRECSEKAKKQEKAKESSLALPLRFRPSKK